MATIENLRKEIDAAKQEFVTDTYSMSIGELISLYKEGDLVVNPNFQRNFRWNLEQQSRLIESILIGVPLPSIFVFQTKEEGKWEVVDGLQRISTILSFLGELRETDGEKIKPTTLVGTKLLPSLEGMTWGSLPKEPLQLQFRRSKINLNIIKESTDEIAKLEVFRRLNYQPTLLSGQEYRNALLIMVDNAFFDWMIDLTSEPNYQLCLDLSSRWKDEKYDQELVLRLFVLPRFAWKGQTKIDAYLDECLFYSNNSLLDQAGEEQFSLEEEKERFNKVFQLLKAAKGEEVFQKPGKGQQFLESYFEAIAIGLYQNIDDYTTDEIDIVRERIETVAHEEITAKNATSRIAKTIPYGKKHFARH